MLPGGFLSECPIISTFFCQSVVGWGLVLHFAEILVVDFDQWMFADDEGLQFAGDCICHFPCLYLF